MQFLAAASLVAASCVAAMPAPVAPRADAIYKVSDFSAACVPHSTFCDYSFGVIQADNGETIPVKCSAHLQSTSGYLPNVTDGTCEQSSRTWTITENEDKSYTLVVSQQISQISFQKGTYTIPADQIVREQTGATVQDNYTGPEDFDLVRTL